MALLDDIQNVFTDDMTDDSFASGISDAIVNFVSTLKFNATSVAGAGPGGTFAGNAQGTLAISGSDLKDKIAKACEDMKKQTSGGDSTLAQGICDGLDADKPQFTVTISGTTTPPAPASPFPSADAGVVQATFISAPVSSALSAAFTSMGAMTAGGDVIFATALATAVQAYYTAAVCVVNGQTILSGSTGTGQITM